MFEQTEIAETIYEGVVKPSYLKKLIEHMINVMVTEGK